MSWLTRRSSLRFKAAGPPGEKIAPGVTRIRGNLCNVHGRYGPCDGAAARAPKRGSGRARKPAAPKPTPEQRQAARDAEQATNRTATLADLDISTDEQGALESLRRGTPADGSGVDSLLRMGLAERGADGTVRLTATGRAVHDAAGRGDTGAVRDAIGRGRDQVAAEAGRASARQERQAAAEARRQEVAARRAQREAERKKPKGGGGGTAKPAPAEKPTASQVARATADTLPVATRITAEGADALRTAADAGGVQNAALTRLGLVGADGLATDQGRRALAALERGSVAGYNAAVQDAQARMAREAAGRERQAQAAQRRAEAEQRRQEAAGRRQTQATRRPAPAARQPIERRATYARVKDTFAVFKDARGADRWLSVTTTAYRDKDGEWISRAAIRRAVAQGDATGQRGVLRFWHVPGLDLGDCDYQATAQDGRFLIESGTFRGPVAARIGQAAAAKGYQMSPGFLHPVTEPQGGVYRQIAIFERSMVPAGRAANPFTRLLTKEVRMLTDEKKKEFEALAGDSDGRAFLATLLAQAAQTDKAAQAGGATFKDDAAGEIKADGVAPVAEVEIEADEPAMDGDFVGDMGRDEFRALLVESFTEALAPVMGALNIEQKMRGMLDEVKTSFGGYAKQKEASDTAQADALAQALARVGAIEASLKEARASVAALTDDSARRAGGYRPSAHGAEADAATAAALKAAQEAGAAGRTTDLAGLLLGI